MILSVRDLHFCYGNRNVLNGLSFSLREKSLTCLLGANGAGKSTLFRCILQFLTTYRGEILLDGRSLQEMSATERARYMAFIPQNHAVAFNYTVEEVVLMATTSSSLFSSPGAKERKRVQAALQKVGVGHLKDRGYAEISAGERQLTLIARALAQDAPILIMDEPTSSLDYGNQIRVMEMVRDLADDGYLVIQSTHHPNQALQYADRVVMLAQGQISAEGLAREVMTQETLSQLYQLPVEVLPLESDRGWICIPKRNGSA